MYRIIFLICVFGTIQGCATSSEVYLSDGSKGYNINCGGALMNYGNCLEKAGEICGEKGYLVVNRQGEAVPFSSSSGSYSANNMAATGGYYSQSGTIITRNLFIKCK